MTVVISKINTVTCLCHRHSSLSSGSLRIFRREMCPGLVLSRAGEQTGEELSPFIHNDLDDFALLMFRAFAINL
jgi:hypothetical protein